MNTLSHRTISLFSDCTKDTLLRSSLELFNKVGFKSVTTAQLASSAGVLEGTLWYHFKSKQNLVEAHIKLFETNLGFELVTANTINIEILIKKLLSQYSFNWDFKYLFRDNLANNFLEDKTLSKKLNDLNIARINKIKEDAILGKEAGIFVFEDDEVEEISEMLFLIANNWFDLSARKYPDKDENFISQRGLSLLIRAAEPYLSKNSKKIIKNLQGEFRK